MPALDVKAISKTPIFKIVLIIIVIALIVGLNLWRNHSYSGQLVNTTKVEEKSMGEKVYASGSIELQEKQEVVARDTRILKQLYVKTGDRVRRDNFWRFWNVLRRKECWLMPELAWQVKRQIIKAL